MNPSRIFIERPVATTLLMVALLMVGMLSYRLLPISALPQVDFPTMQVTTLYPGAGADVVAATVTAPLEKQLGQMPGLAQMVSVSSGEASVVTLRFTLGMNLDLAAQQVQAAIDASRAFLPSNLPTPPIYNKVNPADAPILTLALTSSSLPLTEVQDIADSRLIPKLSQLNGVGLVTLTGGMRPAIRVRLNSQALQARGLSSTMVRNAISAANVNQPKGDLSSETRTATLNANDQLVSPEDYQNLVLAWSNGAAVRLKDVASVENSSENRRLAAWMNEKSALIINIQRQPTANVIEVADQIKALLPQLTAELPSSIHVTALTDRTTTIRASVHDVQIELLTAMILVIAVIFVFLWDGRATLIPAIAVPLSLIGTLTFIHFAGFSLNNLTLMALTIATGFVVDDAIVVVENIARYLEKGDSPMEAALKGSKQIGFTIVSLTISLVAVLIPLLFMGDVVGRLFREFAITLTIAILLSAVISLTLTPMMCARMLKPHNHEEQNAARGIGAAIHRFFDAVISRYAKMLQVVLRHEKLTLLIFLVTLACTALLYQLAPKGFFPSQDTGIIQAMSEARPDISFEAMAREQQQLAKKILADPDVASLSSFLGVDGQNPTLNTGRMLINLKPFEQRSHSSSEIARRLQDTINPHSPTKLFLQPVQDLSIDDRVTRTQYQFTVDATDYAQLTRFVPKILAKLRENPKLVDLASDFQNNGLAAHIDVDRAAAGRLGIEMSTITDALYDAFGQRQVSTIFTQGGQYRVILESEPTYQKDPRSLEQLFVPAANGRSIPLTSIAKISQRSTFLSYTRQDQMPVATFSFNLPKGVSLEAAVGSVKQQLQELKLPATMSSQFQGTSIAFQAALQNQLWLILAAVVVMYLILGILYESFIHPITILSTLPSATLGALLAIHLTHAELGVMAIIGIILLIGIVKKNAIMMIDFALDAQRNQGLPAHEAIYQACLLRFRPILMTTLAALLGALPLMFGTGVGHELRQPLGVTLVGGLLVSQILTLFTTPVIYLLFDRWASRFSRDSSRAATPVPANHA